jgi:hypothetical protein
MMSATEEEYNAYLSQSEFKYIHHFEQLRCGDEFFLMITHPTAPPSVKNAFDQEMMNQFYK